MTAPTDAGEVWFKATPPFLADEGSVIRRVAAVDPDLVPVVLAHDPGRRAILMDHVAGQDEFGLSDGAVAEAMVRRWVGVQAALVDDIEHALAVGARDLRRAALLAEAEDLWVAPRCGWRSPPRSWRPWSRWSRTCPPASTRSPPVAFPTPCCTATCTPATGGATVTG